ncbi:hypothetical protein [Segatella cerevisiae]|uniref:hypothetical protein n=1 Tax=Segatella cerevisiae TaxID=2053716 RepID=UPI00209017C8|nr:hypothetical protein [Segatella cerevisiae]
MNGCPSSVVKMGNDRNEKYQVLSDESKIMFNNSGGAHQIFPDTTTPAELL